MTLDAAIDAFARGFSATRSFTHPYEVHRVGPLVVMRDAPRRSGDTRNEEILVSGIPPDEAITLIRAYKASGYAVCAIDASGAPYDEIKAAYKASGYRFLRREPLFVRELASVGISTDIRIRRVNDLDSASAYRIVSGDRGLLPAHLGTDDAPVRLYNAVVDGHIAGWVRSVDAGGGARWVSNLQVREAYRRQHLGTALMNAMLSDDRRLGYAHSVLLASNAGSKLYPTLGYEQIGLLQLFVPTKGG